MDINNMKQRTLSFKGQYLELGTGVIGLGMAFEANRLLSNDCSTRTWYVIWRAFLGPLMFHGRVRIPRTTTSLKD